MTCPPPATPAGMVYLIGAGPGDPELITLKAVRCLGRCDVVLLDALANDALLRHCRPGTRVVHVGKRGHGVATPQARIDRLMLRLARRGVVVGRLKGGDPLVFARGAEEALTLRAAGVRVEIVPGVTAGIGVPAAAEIAVTRRGHTRGVVLVTGHTCDDTDLDWTSLARAGLTIVVYMGLGRLRAVTDALARAGLPPSTPATAIQDGTLPTQRIVRATLETLADAVATARLRPPTLVVIGADGAGAPSVPMCRAGALATVGSSRSRVVSA